MFNHNLSAQHGVATIQIRDLLIHIVSLIFYIIAFIHWIIKPLYGFTGVKKINLSWNMYYKL